MISGTIFTKSELIFIVGEWEAKKISGGLGLGLLCSYLPKPRLQSKSYCSFRVIKTHCPQIFAQDTRVPCEIG